MDIHAKRLTHTTAIRFIGAVLAGLALASARAATPSFAIALDGGGVAEVTAVDSAGAASVTLPSTWETNDVRALGPYAFTTCEGLEEVVVPASIEQIDPVAFAGCASLTDIRVDAANPAYSDVDGVLFDVTGEILLFFPEGRAGAYAIPENARYIGAGAFANCPFLESLVLPSSILDVAKGAFSGCIGLKSVILPRGFRKSAAALGLPGSCAVTFYEPGGLDDPYLPPRWALAFDANGGRGAMVEQIVPAGETLILPPNAFTRNSHVFAGWASSAGGDVLFADGQSVADLASAGRRVTLYACWTARPYTVRFDANGGLGSMEDVAAVGGENWTLPANAFTRASYTFAGWALSSRGAAAYANQQSVRDVCPAPDGTVTLYAVWSGVTYSVVFHEKGSGGATVTQAMRYGTTTALRKNTFTKKDHVFMGWSRTASGPVAYADGQAVVSLASTAGAKVHLYAQWAVRNYTVRFNPNGGSGSMPDQGFVYGTAKNLSANAFRRTGYTFRGWSTQAGGPVQYANCQALTSLTRYGGRVVLYAQWSVNHYTVVFDANGGTGEMASQTFAYGQRVALRACGFSHPDRIFAYWATSRTGGCAYRNGTTVSNLSAQDGAVIRLYARWAVPTYSIRFDPNGGTGVMADEVFDFATARNLYANKFTYDRHIFLGWSRSRDATKPTYAGGQSVKELTLNGDTITLYAVWLEVGNPNVVVCLGDSITAGIHCYGLPYPSRLARLCGKTVKNCGRGGQTAKWGVSVIEGILRREGPGYVCILFGANDAHGSSPSGTKERLRTIIRTCKRYHATPIIATPTPQRGSWARYNSTVSSIAQHVRSLAREEGVPLVDLNAAFGDGKKYLNPSDGLHLNNAGGDLVARKFNEAIR